MVGLKNGNLSIVDKETQQRVYLDVHYMQRGLAKTLGCRWDPEAKRWFSTPGTAWHDIAVKMFGSDGNG